MLALSALIVWSLLVVALGRLAGPLLVVPTGIGGVGFVPTLGVNSRRPFRGDPHGLALRREHRPALADGTRGGTLAGWPVLDGTGR